MKVSAPVLPPLQSAPVIPEDIKMAFDVLKKLCTSPAVFELTGIVVASLGTQS